MVGIFSGCSATMWSEHISDTAAHVCDHPHESISIALNRSVTSSLITENAHTSRRVLQCFQVHVCQPMYPNLAVRHLPDRTTKSRNGKMRLDLWDHFQLCAELLQDGAALV